MNSSITRPPLLSVQGVNKCFGTVAALIDVTVQIHAGEVHAVLGENGAGKTTLMNAIYGLVRLDAGTIRVHGTPVDIRTSLDARRMGIGMVHQELALVDAFSVLENLLLSLTRPGAVLWKRRQAIDAAMRLSAEVGLDIGDLDAEVGTLPVGTRQRIEILKALAGDAAILILDEPTAVLTPAETTQLFGVLERLRARGTAVLFITHKLGEVMTIADHVTVLRRGRVVAQARRDEVSEAQLAQLMVGALPPDSGRRRHQHAPADAPRLRIDRLSVNDERGLPALRNLSLDVLPGEVFGLAGVDGNGQWELFAVLTGLRTPLSGRLVVAGERLTRFAPAAMIAVGIGHIPPDRYRHGVIAPMSVRENAVLSSVLLRRMARGPFLSPRTCGRVAQDLVDRYAIRAAHLDAPASSLSGGNLQRLIVARALAVEPRVLIAFNPTRGLDIAAASAVYRALDTALDHGVAVLLISTDLDEILTVSDRIAVLYRGRLSEVLRPPFPADHLGRMLAGNTRAA